MIMNVNVNVNVWVGKIHCCWRREKTMAVAVAVARTISCFHIQPQQQHPPQSTTTGMWRRRRRRRNVVGTRFNFFTWKKCQLSLSLSCSNKPHHHHANAHALRGQGQAADDVSDTRQIVAQDHHDHDDEEGTHTNVHVNDESPQTKPLSSNNNNKLLKRLKRYGISGILSYGLLNTVYYLGTFSFVWFYVVPTPGRMGYAAAVERFLKVMAMVWVGSQVTKLARAAGAVALAPLVSRGLTWFTDKFKFGSEGKAFMAIVGVCLGIALLLFFVLTLLSA